jgi:hypothetical protein
MRGGGGAAGGGAEGETAGEGGGGGGGGREGRILLRESFLYWGITAEFADRKAMTGVYVRPVSPW